MLLKGELDKALERVGTYAATSEVCVLCVCVCV
jgi:hypothetical protein